MKPHDIETIILGLTLKYGKDAAGLVLPQLVPERFVYDLDGNFGRDHSIVWKAIADVYLIEGKNPTYVEVAHKLKGEYGLALRSIMGQLEDRFHIHAFDSAQMISLADEVDKQGVVYRTATVGKDLAHTLETFESSVARIEDVDRWAADQLSSLRNITSFKSSGYQHVSSVTSKLRDKWQRIVDGEQLTLLDCGMPSLMRNKLFPRGKIAVVHGLSGSGKSTFAFQVALGTAIGLIVNGVPGCVAINSLEMSQEDLVERCIGILAQYDVSRFVSGTVTQPEVEALYKWADFVDTLPIFVDDTNFLTTSAMEFRAQGLHVSENGPVVQLISDYGELFADDGASEEQRVNKIFREQFRLSREINASVIAISQSTNNTNITGKSYIAGPDGTRYSKGILQATDILAELWNPVQIEASGRTVVAPDGFTDAHPWLFVQKFRGAAAGAAIPFGWIPEHTTFFDMDRAQTPSKEVVYEHLEDALKRKRSSW